jgi:hypothetical protein
MKTEIETEDYAFEILNPPIKKVTALVPCHKDILLGSIESKQQRCMMKIDKGAEDYTILKFLIFQSKI